ncbi:MAG: HAD-IA family hydrolase, partial [Planctomycetota bacterium]
MNKPWWRLDYATRYRGLIFDCDGTLTDSMPLHYIAWRDTMASHGITFTEDRFYGMGGMPTEKIIAVLSDEQNVRVDSNVAAPEKENAFEKLLDRVTARNDVRHVAERHHGRLPMSVASGGLRSCVDRQLLLIGVLDWFPVIVTSEDTDRHKPEPDVFLLAAKKMNVPPEQCLVFEDSPLGLEAARSAKMDCIDVRDGTLHQ